MTQITAVEASDAALRLRLASEYLRDHATLLTYAAPYSGVWSVFAVDNLRHALATLGYDLVPRLTAQQAHDAALARRVAEDRDFGQQDIVLGR